MKMFMDHAVSQAKLLLNITLRVGLVGLLFLICLATGSGVTKWRPANRRAILMLFHVCSSSC
jgi:hypothetical protein